MFTSPHIALREASDSATWEVVLIAAGWSKNNRYYSADLLRRSIPLFENAPISMYGYDPDSVRDHVPGKFRNSGKSLVANIAGWVTGVHERRVEGRSALVGNFKAAGSSVAQLLAGMPKANVLGLSIDALGQSRMGVAEGRRGQLVDSIEHLYEITIVDRPAAGGKFLRMVASVTGERDNRKRNFWEWLRDPVHCPGKTEAGLSFAESIRRDAKAQRFTIGGKI